LTSFGGSQKPSEGVKKEGREEKEEKKRKRREEKKEKQQFERYQVGKASRQGLPHDELKGV
jgi:hypothetical protein